MKSLENKSDFQVKIQEGVTLYCHPINSLDIALARAAADALLSSLQSAQTTLHALGFVSPADFNIEDDASRYALRETLFVGELGAQKIHAWEGFTDRNTGEPLACTPDNIRAVLRGIFVVSNGFWQRAILSSQELLAAKKECATGAHGTQSQEPVANIATAAEKTEALAPAENPGLTEGCAPTSKTPRKPEKK